MGQNSNDAILVATFLVQLELEFQLYIFSTIWSHPKWFSPCPFTPQLAIWTLLSSWHSFLQAHLFFFNYFSLFLDKTFECLHLNYFDFDDFVHCLNVNGQIYLKIEYGILCLLKQNISKNWECLQINWKKTERDLTLFYYTISLTPQENHNSKVTRQKRHNNVRLYNNSGPT